MNSTTGLDISQRRTDENSKFCPLCFTLGFGKFGEQFLDVSLELREGVPGILEGLEGAYTGDL